MCLHLLSSCSSDEWSMLWYYPHSSISSACARTALYFLPPFFLSPRLSPPPCKCRALILTHRATEKRWPALWLPLPAWPQTLCLLAIMLLFFPVLRLLSLPSSEFSPELKHSQLLSPLHLTDGHSVKAPMTSVLLVQWPVSIPRNPRLFCHNLCSHVETLHVLRSLCRLPQFSLPAVLPPQCPLWSLVNFLTTKCRSNSELSV